MLICKEEHLTESRKRTSILWGPIINLDVPIECVNLGFFQSMPLPSLSSDDSKKGSCLLELYNISL